MPDTGTTGPALIRYEAGTSTQTGGYPWQAPERDNWWVARWETSAGTSMAHCRRTAHAHAIGRLLLAELHAQPGETPAAVEIYEYDSDTSTRPGVDTRTGEPAALRHVDPVAVVTDPRPAGPELERFERDLEDARLAKRRYDLLLARTIDSMRRVQDVDPGSPDYRSGNQLAAMAKGVLSRPTVLKLLSLDEDEADE